MTAEPRTQNLALPKAVIGLGLVSLFTDLSSEAIFPLLPAFLTTLGASNAFIGVIEGAAELVSNLLKYVSGLVADRRARMKPLVLVGYGISTIARPLVAFATAPWHVLMVRVTDRVGKGIRTSPRDALIAGVTDPSIRARAYGFHRGMDHAGAALGTLFAIGLLLLLGAESSKSATGDQLRTVFLWAAVPGLFAMIALALIREPERTVPVTKASQPAAPLPKALWQAFLPITLFAFANATDAFVLVKAARLGASPIVAPVIWLVLHVIKASTATFGGRLADRYGRRNALAIGWAFYAVTWSAVGFAETLPTLVILSSIYGVTHGLVEGPEKALVANLAGTSGKGKAFGVYNMLVGFAALLASTGFGVVWDHFGSIAAFVGSGSFAALAALALLARVPADQGA